MMTSGERLEGRDCGKQNNPILRKLWLLVGIGFGLFGALTLESKRVVFSSVEPVPSAALLSERIPLDATPPLDPVTDGQKTIMVTGALGLVGSHLIEFLLRRGDNVIAVDGANETSGDETRERNIYILQSILEEMKTTAFSGNRTTPTLRIYRGDMTNSRFVSHIFAKTLPNYICYLGAHPFEDSVIQVRSNLEGITLLFQLAADAVPQIRNFVYASSTALYSEVSSTDLHRIVDNPISPHVVTQKSAELMAYTFHHLHNISSTGLRIFGVYGPRGGPDMALLKLIDRISHGERIFQLEDGSIPQDYTFVSDIVDGVVRAIDRPYPYQIFDLGQGASAPLRIYIDLVEKHTGQKAIAQMSSEELDAVSTFPADISRAGRFLGYQPVINSDDGVRRMVEWYNVTFLGDQGRSKSP